MTGWKRAAVVCGAVAAATVAGRAHAQAGAPSAAQAIGILQVASEGEMQEASLALARSSNALVRAYANMMIADHGFASLGVAQLGVQPDRTAPQATQLQNQAAQELQSLQPLTGAAFDKAYIQAQVSGHQAVLQLIDQLVAAQGGTAPNTCGPPTDASAGTPSLASSLAAVRSIVQVHLFAAQQLTAALGT